MIKLIIDQLDLSDNPKTHSNMQEHFKCTWTIHPDRPYKGP